MKWPWVLRSRLEDAQRQLTKVEAERDKLLQMVQDMLTSAPEEEKPARQSAPKEAEEFNTPFDAVERNFYKALKGGAIPARFRARVF